MGVRKVKSEVARNEKAAKMEPKRGESEDDALDGLADGLADSEAADRKAAGDEAAERKPSGPPPFVALERCVLACHEELVKDLEDEDVEPACRCSGLEKRPCASGSTCENRAMLVECHECRHGERCHNQRFQRRKYTRTEVRAAGAKGFGLFAVEEIPRGALILEFVGEIIDFLEFKSRMEAAAATGQHLYFMQRDAVTAIDATECGNSGRFINHSCEPNSITERWTIKDRLLDVRMRGEMSTKEITSKAIGFFAMREIAAGKR
ncbi:Chondroitin-glucuronate 5-epimerase [Aphelenchoides fujianensis]|nr:Chondroitin-glucuronate 5-epimerase [Aphelenchoides fujianensis]